MSSDSARSPEEPRTGAPCPLEIFNEFQMDIQDPGPGPTPCPRAGSQPEPDQGARCSVGPGAPSPGAWEPAEEREAVKACRRPDD